MPINLLSSSSLPDLLFIRTGSFSLRGVCAHEAHKKQHIVLSFFVNYALFMVCSFMQLHLVVNWLLIFVLLLIEISAFSASISVR